MPVDGSHRDAGTDSSTRDDASIDSGSRVCAIDETEGCYEGPPGTADVGACAPGSRTCAADGSGFGACTGQTLPTDEDCATTEDDDCDGTANETDAGCVCAPGSAEPCYAGPTGTMGVGACIAGTRTCAADGLAWGACAGEVLPAAETCATPVDDDCDGSVNEEGAGCACSPGSTATCYSGPAGTVGVGSCTAGTQECTADGTGFGPCTGEVLPAAETCATPADEDCDGAINEEGPSCVCIPGSTASCYSGPPGTAGVGLCTTGTRTCNALGTAYGPCAGEVLPATESCSTPADDDCDGTPNDGCATTYAAHVRPILQAHCAPCHTTGSSGSANLASSYADTQLPSYYCAGLTKGACAIVRIHEGGMPRGAGCTGDPAADAANPACLDAAEQTTIEAWVAGGQLP